ncbi:helix-turn-helix domain-containing protein [uncultured Trichococcus sp.]|uniref:helix-turn-helix domain-containing protein n=1 Tax=uncultured Trichococcus sp. TaxID=189665 RepID=UPI002A18C46E|nr:helix-turn-helix domain-containing protein [uncultured Trichococcus sp.]
MANLQIPIPDTFQDELKMMIRNAAAQAIEEAVQRENLAKDWMTQKELQAWLNVSYGTVQVWRGLGLKVATVQGKTLVSKQEVNRFLESYQR